MPSYVVFLHYYHFYKCFIVLHDCVYEFQLNPISAQIHGRKSICDQKNHSTRNARHCFAYGKCITAQIYTTSWPKTWILHADVDTDKRVHNNAGDLHTKLVFILSVRPIRFLHSNIFIANKSKQFVKTLKHKINRLNFKLTKMTTSNLISAIDTQPHRINRFPFFELFIPIRINSSRQRIFSFVTKSHAIRVLSHFVN